MTDLFSIEVWIAILFFLNFFLILMVFLILKKMNRLNLASADAGLSENRTDSDGQASRSAEDIINLLEPLVKESRKAAISFDKQIKEKRHLLKELNDALDSRIISINLLLSRADALQKKIEAKQNQANYSSPLPNDINANSFSNEVINEQNQIIEMYNNNFTTDDIAQSLSIPKGEVQLVIDLKKKFIAMEKDGR